ncbi:cation transporting ATPase C-terminal domain-containing protein, partial [Fructilactobacillus sanfranciscensis]
EAIHPPLVEVVVFSPIMDKMAYVSIFAMILLQLIFTYVPFMNGVFSTNGLSITQWLIVVVASLPVLLVSESNKAWRKKHQLPIL